MSRDHTPTSQYSRRNMADLIAAAGDGDVEDVKKLLESKADVNATDEEEETALHHAADQGFDSIVSMLLDAKATVNVQNREGDTPLIWASAAGHLKIVRMILESKANVDIINKLGNTAVIQSTKNSHSEVTKLLIAVNANLDHINKDGLGAMDFAESTRSAGLVKAIAPRVSVTKDNRNRALLSPNASEERLHKALEEKRKLHEQLANAKDENLMTRAQIQSYKKIVDEQKQTIIDKNLQISAIKGKVEVLKDSEQYSKEENVSLKSELVESQATIVQINQDNRKLRAERTRLLHELDTLKEAFIEKTQASDEKIGELKREIRRHVSLDKDMKKLVEETSKLRNRNSSLRRLVDEAKEIKDDHRELEMILGIALRNGSEMLKHCNLDGSRNKSHKVRFWLSSDDNFLCWDSSGTGKKTRMLRVNRIIRLTQGHESKVSVQALTEGAKSLSFNLTFPERTLALIAPNKEIYDMWMKGFLQLLFKNCSAEIVKASG
ncbi:hypothetical protein AAMO2058_001395300 [Amorphochlora amoebiformis]